MIQMMLARKPVCEKIIVISFGDCVTFSLNVHQKSPHSIAVSYTG